MAQRIGDDERQAIVEAIEAGTPRNDVARQFGRSPGTISNVAQQEGLSFDRTATRAAARAKQADNQARRAELEALLIEDAHRLRAQLWEPSIVYDFTKDGEYVEREHSQPTFGDKRAITQGTHALVKSAAELKRINAEATQGQAEVDRIIDALDEAAA